MTSLRRLIGKTFARIERWQVAAYLWSGLIAFMLVSERTSWQLKALAGVFAGVLAVFVCYAANWLDESGCTGRALCWIGLHEWTQWEDTGYHRVCPTMSEAKKCCPRCHSTVITWRSW